MAYTAIANNSNWEYDNAPPDPANGQSALWGKQVAGIRTNTNGQKVYTACRMVGTTANAGELSKTYWDAQI